MSRNFATGCNGSSTFVIADLHLGDERVAKGRNFENVAAMEAEIVRCWNGTVSNGDKVFMLGDVAKRGHLGSIRKLAGEIHLICGNADDVSEVVGSGIFTSISVARWLSDFLLSHIPVHPSQLRRGMINVHGHLHSVSINDPRYRCVSVEQTGFAPLPLISLRQVG
jgi:calcineurin-like phosphoesterase family protein